MTLLPGQTRVLVVADDPLARAGLAVMVASQPGYAVVGQATGGAELARDLEAYLPDMVVWDLGWDASRAIEQLAALADGGPPVVAFLPDDSQAANAWQAGARGLLLRTTDGEALAAALTAVASGLAAMDPSLAAALLPAGEKALPLLSAELTPRELEVLGLLAAGLPNKGIASRLAISEHTVKFHVNAILSKLGAQSRTEAVALALRLGLTPL